MATTTTNFGLNIVEGTDIVNPLIYDNPNYQKIDEQMFKNQNSGIQKANYAKSGTVHQITRTVQSANVFYFIASANFNVGDTFTVDGGAVTATLPNGTGLQNNAFVINANVVCILNGTALTVLVPADVSQTVNFAETAGKLASPVNIGNASFDGSQNIDLSQIGALPASGGVYSTDPVDTGKKWIDGSPIYRKIVQTEINVQSTEQITNLPLGVTGTKIISVSDYVVDGNGICFNSATAKSNSTDIWFRWLIQSTNIVITSKTAVGLNSPFNVTFVIEYHA